MNDDTYRNRTAATHSACYAEDDRPDERRRRRERDERAAKAQIDRFLRAEDYDDRRPS